MAHIITKWILISTLFVAMNPQLSIHGQPQVPCLFFMGDSLFDNGNNNLLLTMAKANYPPYGIDFPGGIPTGRFSNGKNLADYLGDLLGFPNPIPPFASARGSAILRGVNYASGAAGILDESGIQQGDRISLNRQLFNHKITLARLALLLGSQARVDDYVAQCVYTVYMGSNDYLNNYFLPQYYPSSRLYTPDKFATILIQQYTRQLTTLYNSGARKIAIFGLGLLGCIPQELAMYPANASGCVDFINNAVQLFNNQLKPLVDNFNTNLPNAQFTYINTTSLSLGDPSPLGVTVVNAPCCVISANFSSGQCARGLAPCNNRNQYVFYDNFHPTQLLNLVTAARAYNATLPADAYPVDIRRLAQQ